LPKPWVAAIAATNLDTVVGKVAVERSEPAAIRREKTLQRRRWSAGNGG